MRLRLISTLATALCLLVVLAPGQSSAATPWQGFDDVPPSNIFYDDIMWLHDEGTTKGCNPPENTMFCPADSVTRGQMAAFLSRSLDLPRPTSSDWFVDDDDSVFEDDIDRLAAVGITLGCNPPDNTMFCPHAPVTRAQMASLLVRALDLKSGSGIDWFDDDDYSVHAADIDRLRAAAITFGCNPPTENLFCPDTAVTREQMAALLRRGLTQPQEGAAIGIHGYTWPDPLYLYADMVATFEVRNAGTLPLVDVAAGPSGTNGGQCWPDSVVGPSERLGNGDDTLDPGEIWDWYCGQPAYDWYGVMVFAASGTPAGGTPVTAREVLEYPVIDPVYATVTASAASVEPGDSVTWTIVMHNPSPVNCVRLMVQVRENGEGSYTDFRDPGLVLVGDDDEVFEPGEQWQYEYTATLWSDTYLAVTGSYAPDFSPGTGTGFGYLFSETVTVALP